MAAARELESAEATWKSSLQIRLKMRRISKKKDKTLQAQNREEAVPGKRKGIIERESSDSPEKKKPSSELRGGSLSQD